MERAIRSHTGYSIVGKVMYRQVLDLYATSVDYNPKSKSIAFFKMVQNKLHYAAHGHTEAEVIYERSEERRVGKECAI